MLFCGFPSSFFSVVCVWLKDVLITIRQGREEWMGGKQSKHFYGRQIADSIVCCRDFSSWWGALWRDEGKLDNAAKNDERKKTNLDGNVPRLKKVSWPRQDDGNRQIVRLTKHKVSTQNSNSREVWRQQTPSVMQNWFQFMALLLQIKKKERRDDNFLGCLSLSSTTLRLELFFMYSCRIILSRSQQLFKLLLKFTFVLLAHTKNLDRKNEFNGIRFRINLAANDIFPVCFPLEIDFGKKKGSFFPSSLTASRRTLK